MSRSASSPCWRRRPTASSSSRRWPTAPIEQVDLRAIERDYVNDENEPGSEMDHIVFIKYKTDKVQA